TSETLDQLQTEIPKGLIPLLRLPGLGGKKVSKLYQELGITDDVSLKEAIESKQVENLAGFGKKSAEKILLALEGANSRPERLPYAILLPFDEIIESFLKDIPEVM